MNLDAIREGDIATAVGMADLVEACAYLQGIAGITDGGVAADCFNGVDWTTADPLVREQRIRHWLATEQHFIDDVQT